MASAPEKRWKTSCSQHPLQLCRPAKLDPRNSGERGARGLVQNPDPSPRDGAPEVLGRTAGVPLLSHQPPSICTRSRTAPQSDRQPGTHSPVEKRDSLELPGGSTEMVPLPFSPLPYSSATTRRSVGSRRAKRERVKQLSQSPKTLRDTPPRLILFQAHLRMGHLP